MSQCPARLKGHVSYPLDSFDEVGDVVGSSLVNIVGQDNRAFALQDLVDSELEPPIRLAGRDPIKGVDAPEGLAIAELPDRLIDGRVGPAVRRTEQLLRAE